MSLHWLGGIRSSIGINTSGAFAEITLTKTVNDNRALRVTKLGAGLKIGSLRSDEIAEALTQATTDRTMIEKAAEVGHRIRTENGVQNALEYITFNIIRAGQDRTKMQWGK